MTKKELFFDVSKKHPKKVKKGPFWVENSTFNTKMGGFGIKRVFCPGRREGLNRFLAFRQKTSILRVFQPFLQDLPQNPAASGFWKKAKKAYFRTFTRKQQKNVKKEAFFAKIAIFLSPQYFPKKLQKIRLIF